MRQASFKRIDCKKGLRLSNQGMWWFLCPREQKSCEYISLHLSWFRIRIMSHYTVKYGGREMVEVTKLLTVCRKAGMAARGTFMLKDLAYKTCDE